ncbi:lysophospholipid acyltransferase family protein [Aestuariirhabdus litorea]|uniref:1-acyl-sn-glycerol-3-phosphate acyltransferase n=1 Tax=Aestuariirhabdus litorea TaxID=2528527 RepID=A0A3P3VJC4_9GAMM|nr:lysophospholipid acyltransferase family protein [Aestuariirhabdus litorea]RRJ82782.1 1-acyl-sn-glycerol-3-phosphate acyltransferase [Aestuariirhabdus litorea]RWW93670.1 1-acyl-sn-glycerol-3-phosphate acyltransferase [Endozoicomonadaceae bacterium GTF-13]
MRWLPAIDWLWRLIATAMGFSLFGLGALLLALLCFPLINLLSRDSGVRKRRVKRLINLTFRTFTRIVTLLGVFRVEFAGTDRLRSDRGCLIIANHPSLVDFVLLGSQVPDCDCIVKQALWSNPFLKGVVSAADYLPNSTGPAMIERCRQRLAAGERLIVFPEGTRTEPGQAVTLNRGAANIAVRTGRPIRLVHIHCQPPVFTRNTPWYRIPAQQPRFRIEVGALIDPQPLIDQSPSLAVAARTLTRELQQQLNRPLQREAEQRGQAHGLSVQ